MRGLQTLVSLRGFLARDSVELLKVPAGFQLSIFEDGTWQQSRGLKKQANEIRSGNVLDVNGRLMQVLKYQHTQGAGRQLGNVQLELRDLLSKNKHQQRVRPYDMVEVVRLEERPFQCLYLEGQTVHCMDPSNFEQVSVEVGIFGTQGVYLAEGLDITLNFHDGNPITGEVPSQIVLTVAEAAPHMKGETAAPSYKPAVLTNGMKLMVPPFIERGDQVVVDTQEGAFVRRAA